MLLVMGVSLFTVRIVLKVLGVEDYGIYNVVAGIVSMFGFLSGTMASASQRFFAFEIGKKDFVKLKQTFSMTVTIYAMLAILIIILAETVGLWFLNNKMTIPPDRMEAARWVYHFAIASFVVTIMAIPYNAAIIAKENMKVFAFISIIEVLLKLGIVYILVLFDVDKLKLYAVLMLISTICIQASYSLYCRRAYSEFKYSFYWDRGLFQTLVGFSGWMVFGCLADMLSKQGVNVLINVFFGPIFNATRAIAIQIHTAVNSFVLNFIMAVNPQIIKSFSSGDIQYAYRLVFSSSKISFFLLFFLTFPVILYTDNILSLWLKEIPPYSTIFVRLVIIELLITALYSPIAQINQASGNIKKYQLLISLLFLLIFIFTFFAYYFSFPVYFTFVISIFMAIVGLITRLKILENQLNFPLKKYFYKTIKPIFFVTFVSVVVPLIFYIKMPNTILFVFINSILWFFCLICSVWFLGTETFEREVLLKKIYEIKQKKNDKN